MAERARREPGLTVIGIDPSHAGLIEVSRKADGPAKKGGLPNALFVLGSAEDLPGPFTAMADSASILFPWGSLMRAAVLPEPAFVASLAALCRPGATVELVYSFDARDAVELERLGLAGHTVQDLRAGYEAGAFAVCSTEKLDVEGIRAYPTTWARKLSAGSERVATRVVLTLV